MQLPPYPVSGEPVRATWGRQIVDYLRSITPLSGTDILRSTTANGTTFSVRKKTSMRNLAATIFRKPFDLENIGNDSYSIMDYLASAGGLWIDAAKDGTLEVDGFTFVTDHWERTGVAAEEYVYLLRDYDEETTTLTADSELPDGTFTDTPQQEIIPLWYIPWIEATEEEDGSIDADGIIDLRGAVRLYTPIPGGDAQYKVLDLDANKAKQWDWVRAHG